MAITENDVKKITFLVLLGLLAILSFLIIRPVLLSVLAGLILAYIFLPVHRYTTSWVKSKTLSAAIVSIVLLLIIAVPLWFLLPMISQQVFEVFKASQELDVTGLVQSVFPTASEQFTAQADATVKKAFSGITSSILDSIVDLLLNFATISLHLLLVAFVFFFTLKDEEQLRNFASGIIPLGKNQEKRLTKQFKDITHSILYGQVVAGIIQGSLAALALYVFGIPNALLLSVFALVLSVIPVIGPSFVYIPVSIYMLMTTNPLLAIGYLLFNVLIVSSVDSVFRSHFVSRRTNMSQAVILVGMIGGLFMFNILGLIIGPLILAYFITFLRAYKEKTISSFFE